MNPEQLHILQHGVTVMIHFGYQKVTIDSRTHAFQVLGVVKVVDQRSRPVIVDRTTG